MTPHAASGNRQRGFTLIEVLAAIAVMALLLTAAVQAHIGLLRQQRARIYERGRDVTAQRVVDRIERELLSTLLVVKPEQVEREKYPWVFQGTDGGNVANQGDTLRFITYNSGGSGDGVVGLRLVSYLAGPGEDEESDLYRLEEPLPEAQPGKLALPDEPPALRGVHVFQLRYRDEKSSAWKDTWDSTSNDDLPSAVEVTLQLAERNEAGDPILGSEIQRIVPLPVRPVPQANGKSSCEMGPTVQQCLGQVKSVFDPEKLAELQELGKSAPDACLLDEKAPQEVQDLKEALMSEGVMIGQGCSK